MVRTGRQWRVIFNRRARPPHSKTLAVTKMSSLISPDYDLVAFCYRVMDGDPVTVMEAASSEISYARRLHREKTRESNFRHGSKGRFYCEQLQYLISMLMNGHLPSEASPEFRENVRPLVKRLLERWDIGTLRTEFSKSDG